MANDFYNHGSFPTTGAAATSASMRAELDSIAAGFDKLPDLTANANKIVVVNASSDALTQIATLPATSGGTGFASYAVGDLVYAGTTTTLAKLADVVTGNALISGGVGVAPSYGKIGLTTHVSGTLPAANGGTGQASYAVGDLLYASTTTALSKLADVAAGNALISGGVGVAPTYGKIGLTTHISGTLGVANGGTGLTAGTSGGVLYYSAAGTLASSAALASNALVIGGGAGSAPSTITTGTGVVTALGVNTGSAGAFVLFNGALGTPTSGTVTNLTGTASININGTVGATTANTGAFTSITSTSAAGVLTRAAATQDGIELIGRAGGTTSLKVTLTPTTLSASRTITFPDANINFTTGLPVANGGTGLTSGTSGGVLYYSATGTLASSAALAASAVVLGGGAGSAPATTTTGTGVVTAIGNAVNTTGGLVTQSGTLTASALLLGGGSGTAITSTTTGTGVVTALGNAANATGGFATINGTATLTNKRIDPRTSSTASTASLTPDISAFDQYNLTAQAATLAVNAPTGTPVDGNKLVFRILDNGVAQTINWNGTYTAIGVTLPTTTVASKMTYVGCIYNSTNTRWDVVAVVTQT